MSKRPNYDASDPEQVAQRTEEVKALDVVRKEGLRLIMENKASRAWLRNLLAACGVHRTSFTGNSETFFKEGQRNIGLMIEAEILKNHPDLYLTLLKEGI